MDILYFECFGTQYNFLKKDRVQSNKEIRKILRSFRGREIHVGYTILTNGLLYDTSVAGHFCVCAHQNAINLKWGSRSEGGEGHMRMGFSRIDNIAIFKRKRIKSK